MNLWLAVPRWSQIITQANIKIYIKRSVCAFQLSFFDLAILSKAPREQCILLVYLHFYACIEMSNMLSILNRTYDGSPLSRMSPAEKPVWHRWAVNITRKVLPNPQITTFQVFGPSELFPCLVAAFPVLK